MNVEMGGPPVTRWQTRRHRGRLNVDLLEFCTVKREVTTGSNPTDLGGPHLITDRGGILFAPVQPGVNVHGSMPFEDLIDAVPQAGSSSALAGQANHRRCRQASTLETGT
jgi:hypothetical protein